MSSTTRTQLGRRCADEGWRPRLVGSQRLVMSTHRFLVYVVLIAVSTAFLSPLLWMLSTSLKEEARILAMPPQLVPSPVDWANYPETFATRGFNFLVLLKNTLLYAVLETFGIVVSCVLAAYGFARTRWPGRDIVFMITIVSMMIPGTVTLVPVYMLFNRLGWVGTLLPLIVPGFFGKAFMIFLLRQFFKTIPLELSEAAVVDGASHWQILLRIMVPLAKPVLATVVLLEFLNCWTDFMGPLIYLMSEDKFTLSLGLYAFRSQWVIRYDLMMAAAAAVTIPILVIFFFAQRTFIEGIALAGIKG